MKDEKYLVQASEMLKDWFSDIKDLSQQPITKYPGFVKIWAEAWSVYDDFQPIIDVVVQGGKIVGLIKLMVEARSIPDKLFKAKVKKFVKNFSKLSNADIQKFTEEYQNNSEKTQQLGEALLLLLDKFEDLNKAKLLGLFFVAKCQSDINEEEYNTFAHALCNIDIKNIKILKKYYEDFDKNKKIQDEYQPKIESLSKQLEAVNDDSAKKNIEEQREFLIKERDAKKLDVDSQTYRTFLTGFANVGLLSISSVSGGFIFAPPYYPNELGRKFIKIVSPALDG